MTRIGFRFNLRSKLFRFKVSFRVAKSNVKVLGASFPVEAPKQATNVLKLKLAAATSQFPPMKPREMRDGLRHPSCVVEGWGVCWVC